MSRITSRQDFHLLDFVNAALGLGFEAADGLDFVAEELEAVREFARNGKDVKDAAADAHVAALFDHDVPAIADIYQARHELLEVVLVAQGQRDDVV